MKMKYSELNLPNTEILCRSVKANQSSKEKHPQTYTSLQDVNYVFVLMALFIIKDFS